MTIARLPGAAIFAAITLLLAVGGLLEIAHAVERRDVLAAGIGAVLLALSVPLGYETAAYGFRLDRTISLLVSDEFAAHPWTYLGVFVVVMGLAGALAQHFVYAGHRPHLAIILAGIVAFIAGQLVTEATGWVP